MKAFPHLTRPTPPYTQITRGLIFPRGPGHMRKCGVTHLMRKCGATMRATVSPLRGSGANRSDTDPLHTMLRGATNWSGAALHLIIAKSLKYCTVRCSAKILSYMAFFVIMSNIVFGHKWVYMQLLFQ